MILLSRNTFYHLVKAPDFCKEIMGRFTVIALSLICFLQQMLVLKECTKPIQFCHQASWSKIAVKESGYL